MMMMMDVLERRMSGSITRKFSGGRTWVLTHATENASGCDFCIYLGEVIATGRDFERMGSKPGGPKNSKSRLDEILSAWGRNPAAPRLKISSRRDIFT